MERFDKKLVIITRASDKYGFGHVMRSLRNYNLLKDFFSCKLVVIGNKNIREKLLDFSDLNTLYLDFSNKISVEKIINDFNPEGIIIDLLSIDTWLSDILKKNNVIKKIWFSDLGKCNKTINHIFVVNPKVLWQDNESNMIECMDFLDFNENLKSLREKNYFSKDNIYINAGGVISTETKYTLHDLIVKLKDYKLKGFLNLGFSEKKMSNMNNNFKLITNSDNHYEYIKKSRVSIIAGGFTRYEMAFIGMPMLLFSMNNHQKRFAKDFEKNGLGLYIGDVNDISTLKNVKKINNFFSNKTLHKKLSNNCKNKIKLNSSTFLKKIQYIFGD